MAEFAKYIGTATTRRMLERDWQQAGVRDQGTVEWSKRNGYVVARDQLTDEAWDMLAGDKDIVVVDTDHPTPAQITEAHTQAAVARMQARAAQLAVEADDDASTAVSGPSDEA